MDAPRRPPEYPFEEFCRHFDELHAQEYFSQPTREASAPRGTPRDFITSAMEVHDYMQGLYSDNNERQYKVGRFVLIMSYISDRIDEFEKRSEKIIR